MPQRILILGYVWPEPTSWAAGVRDLALVRHFRDAGWEVTFASAAKLNPFQEALKVEEGIGTRLIHLNDESFEADLKDICPDVVLFDRFVTEEQFGWRVRACCPEALRVLDTQDLHFLRRGREDALKRGLSMSEIAELGFEVISEDALREVASVFRSDLTLILSNFEYALLKNQLGVPAELLELSPFSYPPPRLGPAFETRNGFVMVGNFRHPPNADAVRWLQAEVFPLIRKELPTAFLHIYGAYPPKELMALSDPGGGFEVRGHAENLIGTLDQYRVGLAPLRFGAGIKGKIADSWWSGLPVAATSIGAEGMLGDNMELSFGGAIADSAEEFARAAVHLHQDQESWSRACAAGQAAIRAVHDSATNGARLIESIGRLQVELRQRRIRNIFGAILWREQNRSTEYFSRWIEEKNRKNRVNPAISALDRQFIGG